MSGSDFKRLGGDGPSSFKTTTLHWSYLWIAVFTIGAGLITG